MIRFAKDKDMIRLREIWKASFHDSDEGTARIFETLNIPQNILVLTNDDDLAASMLCIREFALTFPQKSYKAAYIYGVATDEKQRGKGFGTRLLEHAHELLKHNGCVLSALVPSQKSLFGFYGARGYETAFNLNKAEVSSGEIKGGEIFPLFPVTAQRYAKIRNSIFQSSKMFARWDLEWISYIALESAFYGGGMFTLTVDGKQLCAACYLIGGTLYVKELGTTADTADTAIRCLSAHFNPEKIVLYLREDVQTSYTNNLLPFGMIRWYDGMVKNETSAFCGNAPYITHVLD